MAIAATPPAGRALRVLGPIAAALSLLSAFVTFVVLADLTPVLPSHDVVVSLLLINAFTVFLLLGVIAREVWLVVQARRRGRAAARLHVRIVGLFSIIAAVPAILVAIVASITLDRGLDRLFSTRTKAVIENSMMVADAYMREHAHTVRGDILAMSFDLTRAKTLFDTDRERFRQFLTAQAQVRGLSAAMMIEPDLSVIERADIKREQDIVMPSAAGLATVGETEPQIGVVLEANSVAAVIKLRGYDDVYLHMVRPLDPRVVAQLRETQASVSDFRQPRGAPARRAARLRPDVHGDRADRAAVGGLDRPEFRQPPGGADPPPDRRGQYRLDRQSLRPGADPALRRRPRPARRDLQQDDPRAADPARRHRARPRRHRQRRRFTEAVLAGASAGVIGVDGEGRISILNRSAERLIGRTEAEALGQPLTELVPELAEIFANAQAGAQRLVQGQVTISRQGRERNLSVRVTTEQSGDPEHGYVVTLDDITELVSAQRTSAWADVARRIAHEIKNPLTPIQLSAERLRRKYGKTITDDPAVFEQCTDTIVRQVDDIKRMVDEFSQFARMPKPVIDGRGRRRHGAPGGVPDAGRQRRHRHRSRRSPRIRCRRASTAG